MDPKAKKTKLKLKRETVRTLDESALTLLDGVAGGTRPSTYSTCDETFMSIEQSYCIC